MLPLPLPPTLRDRLASVVVSDYGDGGEVTVLPSGGVVLGLQLSGRIRAGDTLLSEAGVTGLQPTLRRYAHVGGTRSILIRFTPQGATCLGVPASELTGASVPLEALLPGVTELLDRFHDAPTVAASASVVARFLAARPFTPDPLVSRAVRSLDAAPTPDEDLTVAHLARALGLSERHLERRFLAQVGVTPKRYASLRRFERAATRLTSTEAPLGQLALETGYYDQSHFTRELRRFTGMTPGQLRATPLTVPPDGPGATFPSAASPTPGNRIPATSGSRAPAASGSRAPAASSSPAR